MFEVDDDIDTTTVSSIVNSRNFWQFLVAHQIGDLFEQVRTVHLVGNLGDHDRALAVLPLFDAAFRTNREASTARLISFLNAFAAHDDRTRWEIRSGKYGHELFGGHIRIVEHHASSVDGLA